MSQMWKAQTFKGSQGNVSSKATQPPTQTAADDDDWDTGAVDKVVTEKGQRWGQGREVEIQVPLRELVKQAQQDHDNKRLEEYKNTSNFSHGYGGQFGVQAVMDKSAVDFYDKGEKTGTTYTPIERPKEVSNERNAQLRSRFEAS